MKAAIVTDFDRPPHYGDTPEPAPITGEVLIRVAAAAVSQLVRMQAAGRHYSSPAHTPFVPGVDAVGRIVSGPDEGRRVYCAFPRMPHGTMAEMTVVSREYCVDLPESVDDATAAAMANPGMSSWVALLNRARFVAGESVLVNGATGASGRLAVQIARHLGARRVVATGRTAASVAGLTAIGADQTIALDQSSEALIDVFRRELRGEGVDVVLDYLWGTSAEAFITACAGHGGREREPRVRFVQIGAMSAPAITLPGATLRSSGVELLGSGLGSASNGEIVSAVAAVMQAAGPAGLGIATERVPLSEVEQAWSAPRRSRVVLTM